MEARPICMETDWNEVWKACMEAAADLKRLDKTYRFSLFEEMYGPSRER